MSWQRTQLVSSRAALGLQTDAAVTLYRLCRACNPYSARPSSRARASMRTSRLHPFGERFMPPRLLPATDLLAMCLVPNQRLRYLLGRPTLRSTAPMDAWPCLAPCFTSVLWSVCFSLRLLTPGALATNLFTLLA